MTYIEFKSFLTLKERKEFKRNCREQAIQRGIRFTSVKTILAAGLEKDETFFQLVAGGFNWSTSPEGYDYWFKIAHRKSVNDKKSTHGARITLEQCRQDYALMLKECKEESKLLKAKGLNLYLNPYEIEDHWKYGRYFYPANFWETATVDKYLKPYSDKLRNAQSKYDYAHKRVKEFLKTNKTNKQN